MLLTTIVYCLTVISLSQLPHVLANIGDEEDRYLSSGSGVDKIIDPPRNTVLYKKVEMKFVTKHAFQNSPTNGVFMAEVTEELAYALNSEGGPMPMVLNRPAMVQTEEIKRESSEIDFSPSQRPGNNPMRFKGFIGVPSTVDVEEYFNRIRKNKFFHSLRRIREDNRNLIELSEGQLKAYAEQRLPPREGDNGGTSSVEINPVPGPEENPPPNNQPGSIEIDVHYPINTFFKDPATLAAMIAAALAGLLCTILCTVFVVYRMRKKDEGSYALDEPKNTYRYNKEIYIASATKEFFA